MLLQNFVNLRVHISCCVDMAEIAFEYTTGKRFGSQLVYTIDDKQLFRKAHQRNGVHYKCYIDTCSARLLIRNNICTRQKDRETHNHQNQEKDYEQFKKETDIKRRSRSDPLSSVRKICDEEEGSSNTPGSSNSVYNKYKSTIYFNQRKSMPINPNSLQESDAYFQSQFILNLLLEQVDGKKVYHSVSSDGEAFIALFGSEEILGDLPDERVFQITTTMRVVPSSGIFKNLLTLSLVKDMSVSFKFCFLRPM